MGPRSSGPAVCLAAPSSRPRPPASDRRLAPAGLPAPHSPLLVWPATGGGRRSSRTWSRWPARTKETSAEKRRPLPRICGGGSRAGPASGVKTTATALRAGRTQEAGQQLWDDLGAHSTRRKMHPAWGPDTCRWSFAMISSGCFCKEIISVEKCHFSIIYTVIKFISRNGTSQSSLQPEAKRKKSHPSKSLHSPVLLLFQH
ncbi:uncharacterized protein LOC130681189 [Manis pentadactyla]|uniref:uncharacterized protein LOC130681189 n=1 Tax=Manis pentadactyla TaxID=143292 RepID=UPI00255CF116|nr:uncharacterized protein LOC130681189 [Manis pentadactyla]